jgi:hypothetical protein
MMCVNNPQSKQREYGGHAAAHIGFPKTCWECGENRIPERLETASVTFPMNG